MIKLFLLILKDTILHPFTDSVINMKSDGTFYIERK